VTVCRRRIQVYEGGHSVPIVAQAPLLSSSQIPWEGVLLEEHSTATQQTQLRHIRTVFLVLHTGASLRQEWRNAGKFHTTLTTTGSVHLLTPGPERSLTHRDQLDCIVLSIEPSYLHRALEDSLLSERVELVERLALEDPQIERLVRALLAETKAGAPTGGLFGQSIATGLAVYLAQRYSSSPPTLRRHRDGMPTTRLNRVLECIAAKLHEDLSLAALAEIAGMNLYYFSRLFKQSTGRSPHRYVLEQRITRAQQFLRSSDMTIFEASVRTGFADQGHFAKVFRRFVGVSPTAYRAKCR
jgi:AraC family transcriptional regulator